MQRTSRFGGRDDSRQLAARVDAREHVAKRGGERARQRFDCSMRHQRAIVLVRQILFCS